MPSRKRAARQIYAHVEQGQNVVDNGKKTEKHMMAKCDMPGSENIA